MPAGKGSLQSHFKDTEDSAVVVKLRDDQAGFRKERSCTHQIAILRIIVHPSNGILRSTSTLWITKKLSTAWTESLFGSLWGIMRFLRNLSSWFPTPVRVHDMQSHTSGQSHTCGFLGSFWSQAGMSSITIPVPAGYWLITRKTTAKKRNGSCRKKTSDLASYSAQLGLNIHRQKTKILRLNITSEHPVTLSGEPLEDMESFSCLGSTIDKLGGIDADTKFKLI